MDLSNIDYKKWSWAFAVIGFYVIFMIIVIIYGLRDRQRLGRYRQVDNTIEHRDPEAAWEPPRIANTGHIELANRRNPDVSSPSRGMLNKQRR